MYYELKSNAVFLMHTYLKKPCLIRVIKVHLKYHIAILFHHAIFRYWVPEVVIENNADFISQWITF